MKPKYSLPVYVLLLLCATVCAQSDLHNDSVYSGKDLGVRYKGAITSFKIWTPRASEVLLRLYAAGDGGQPLEQIKLLPARQGIWETIVHKNIVNRYYTFQVKQDGKWLDESPDINAKAVGVNGKRGMVVDLKTTNPVNWAKDKKPLLKNLPTSSSMNYMYATCRSVPLPAFTTKENFWVLPRQEHAMQPVKKRGSITWPN